MGNNPSNNNEPVQLALDHPLFRNTKQVTSENKKFMEIKTDIDQKEYEKWKAQLKDMPTSQNSFLLLPSKDSYASKGFCGSTGTATILFDYFPYLLHCEIANRRKNMKEFQETELWYLLYGLVSAKSKMKPSFSKIGDVRPRNTFINDEGMIKVVNLFSWPHQSTNYSKSFEKQTTFLSPEELNLLKQGKIEEQENEKSEMFSIGMTVLSTALVEDLSFLYNVNNYQFDSGIFKRKLDELRMRKFSQIFKGTVMSLCEVNPEKRISPRQMWEFLAPHAKKIENRQNFVIQNAPSTLHRSVFELRESLGLLNRSMQPLQQRQVSPRTPTVASYQSVLKPQNVSIQQIHFPPQMARSSVPIVQQKEQPKPYKSEKNATLQNMQRESQIQESVYIPANEVPKQERTETNTPQVEKVENHDKVEQVENGEKVESIKKIENDKENVMPEITESAEN